MVAEAGGGAGDEEDLGRHFFLSDFWFGLLGVFDEEDPRYLYFDDHELHT